MGARRVRGTRDFRPSVRLSVHPPPGWGPGSLRSIPAGQRWAAGPYLWGCGTGRPRCGCGRGRRRCCFPGCPLPRRGRSSRRCCSPWPPASGTWRNAWKVRPRDGAGGEGWAARGRRRGPARGGGGLYSIRLSCCGCRVPTGGAVRRTSGRRSLAQSHALRAAAQPCSRDTSVHRSAFLVGRSPRGGVREEGAVWPCRAGNGRAGKC